MKKWFVVSSTLVVLFSFSLGSFTTEQSSEITTQAKPGQLL
ncbi:hypothetical protein [Shouchella clausii]|jgi:hypothetical protein|nr:hypothetical protein [Shouchella clausii]MCY1104443.1 hypothetical protein [Shouchella clausii]MEB5480621.1 hypothetical protein [Shouchella clausii]SHL63349.1 hypothetical protein SAMN05192535_2922 [Shouchella rhizosphaerae]